MVAIEANGLGKRYNLGRSNSGNLRESFSNLLNGVSKKSKDKLSNEFWALRDVSFQIPQGEAVGIIGRNGAGKSTLLKILSRITHPTTGRVVINGRVSSLLEVGTGFHPELTGRENIFLNGTILGMNRREVKSKFDEIVSFSGVEKFIDTPVKHYSSGMQVRLAFSVAAYLDPEILLVDEVLAVGDAEFQKKCLGKMENVTNRGRTVLFVSHNMGAVERLCSSGILVERGQISKYDTTKEMIDDYLASFQSADSSKLQTHLGGNDIVLLKAFSHDTHFNTKMGFNIHERLGLSFDYLVNKNGLDYKHAINLHNEDGVNVLNSIDFENNPVKTSDRFRATVWIPGDLLNEGVYFFSIACIIPTPYKAYFHEKQIVKIRIGDDGSVRSSRGNYSGNFPGVIRPMLKWDSKRISND